jgi:hypothetical protein
MKFVSCAYELKEFFVNHKRKQIEVKNIITESSK